jgi:hypothetical protein
VSRFSTVSSYQSGSPPGPRDLDESVLDARRIPTCPEAPDARVVRPKPRFTRAGREQGVGGLAVQDDAGFEIDDGELGSHGLTIPRAVAS